MWGRNSKIISCMNNQNKDGTLLIVFGFIAIAIGLSAFIDSNSFNSWFFLLLPLTSLLTLISLIFKIKNSQNSKMKRLAKFFVLLLLVPLILSVVWWIAASGA